MKRFWREVSVADGAIRLDGKPVRTPGKALLSLPSPALADAIAEEWRAVGDTLDPRAMPLTGLANAALDIVPRDRATFAASLSVYVESELLAYRAESPPELIAHQAEVWNPLLQWACSRYDVAILTTHGIVHVAQPPETLARLSRTVASLNDFRLAGLSPLVTIGGSLVIALAVLEGEMEPNAAFDAAHLDELWQAEMWGEDALALEARDARRADFAAAARFLSLL